MRLMGLKRTIAAIMALVIVGGAMPSVSGDFFSVKPITAQAIESNTKALDGGEIYQSGDWIDSIDNGSEYYYYQDDSGNLIKINNRQLKLEYDGYNALSNDNAVYNFRLTNQSNSLAFTFTISAKNIGEPRGIYLANGNGTKEYPFRFKLYGDTVRIGEYMPNLFYLTGNGEITKTYANKFYLYGYDKENSMYTISDNYGVSAELLVKAPADREQEVPIGVNIAFGEPNQFELVYSADHPLPNYENVTIGKKWFFGDLINTNAYFKVDIPNVTSMFEFDPITATAQFARGKLQTYENYKVDANDVINCNAFRFRSILSGCKLSYRLDEVEWFNTEAYDICFLGDSENVVGIEIVGGSGTEEDPFTIAPITETQEGAVDFNENNGVITLSGAVKKDDIRAYAGNEKVRKVVCNKGTVLPSDCEELFKGFMAYDIDLSNADFSKVKGKVNNMFAGCSRLDDLRLGNFDASGVTFMNSMFEDCTSLKYLDLANFNTSGVYFMKNLFKGCSALEVIFVGDNWSTAHVGLSDNGMFAGCTSLVGGKGTVFDSTKTDKTYARLDSPDAPGYFTKHCCSFDESTATLTISGDVIRNEVIKNRVLNDVMHVVVEDGAVFPADCSYLFSGYIYAEDFTFGDIDTSNVTNMFEMFDSCNELKELDLRAFDTSNVTDMSRMFLFCDKLENVDVSSFNTSKVTTMRGMFSASNIKSLDLRNFDTSNVTDMAGMFTSREMTYLNVSNFNTSKVTDMSEMFWACSNLSSLDLSNFDTSKVTNMKSMFLNCSSLTSLDLRNFNTSNVTNMGDMFSGCKGLTSLNVSSFNTGKVTNMRGMFSACHSLESLDVTSFDTSNVTTMREMFILCKNLKSIDVSHFNTGKVTSMNSMFDQCISLKSLDLRSFDTSSLNDICYMFMKCYELETIDLSSFDTSKFDTNTTSLGSMYCTFSDCPKLHTIYASDKWVTPTKVSSGTFACCNGLLGQNGTPFNPSYINSSYARIDGKDGKQGYFTDKYIVKFKENPSSVSVNPANKALYVKVSYSFTPSEGYTSANEYGILYCNDGTITDPSQLTLEAAQTNSSILIKSGKTGTNLRDYGKGVVAVGYVKVKNSAGAEEVAYTGDLGGRAVIITENEPVIRVSNKQLYVGVSYSIKAVGEFTTEGYGILYCNDGTITDPSMLTLEAAETNSSIQKKAGKTGTNLLDKGKGVVAVGYNVVKNAKGQEAVIYTGNVGGQAINITENAPVIRVNDANKQLYVGISYAITPAAGLTVSDYGILYCNDGTITDPSQMTLEAAETNSSIQKKAGKTGTNFRDYGKGVVAVGYNVVTNSEGKEAVVYTGDIGGRAVIIKENPPVPRTNNGKNYVGVSYSIQALGEFTTQSYGILYCNDGKITDPAQLTLDSINTSIQKKEGKTGTNLHDTGKGVLAVGYNVVKNSKNQEAIIYTDNIGGKYADLT